MSADLWNSSMYWLAYAVLLGGAAAVLSLAASLVRALQRPVDLTTFWLGFGFAAVGLVLRRAWRVPKKSKGSKKGGDAVAADAKVLDGYAPGTEVVMGFRRQAFVWTEGHMPGRVVAEWEHRTDAADKRFTLGMGVDAFREEVADLAEMPAWVDWDLLDEGCRFFVQVWPLVFYGFSWALLGGFGAETASAVLLKSRYWAAKGTEGKSDTWKRLRETACWLYDAAAHGAAGYKAGGESWKACLHVRYLHCRTRATIRAAGDWDTAKFGEPINQTQIAGTLLGSSVLLLQGMEELLGVQMTQRKKEAFTHLWRVIGFLFGLDEAFNPNAGGYARATVAMESIFSHGIPAFPDPSLTGVLTQHICESVAHGVRTEFGAPVNAGMIAVSAWYFLGDTYGSAVGLPASPRHARVLGLSRILIMRCVFLWYFLPGAPAVFERLMRYLFTAMVNQIRKQQPQCRFGVCPMGMGKAGGDPALCPGKAKSK